MVIYSESASSIFLELGYLRQVIVILQGGHTRVMMSQKPSLACVVIVIKSSRSFNGAFSRARTGRKTLDLRVRTVR